MRIRNIAIAFVIFTFGAVGIAGAATSSKKSVEYLYAITAKGGSYDGKRITLRDVPSVIYMSDRPSRDVGHISASEFLKIWNSVQSGLKNDPPNAVFAFVNTGDEASAVVELTDMSIDGSTISYSVKMLDGTLPSTFDASSLFIDMIDPEYGLQPARGQ